MSRADRWAVPLMLAVGALMTWACLEARSVVEAPRTWGWARSFGGLDLVIAYQVSWLLMFADYSRFTADASKARTAVFLALAFTSAWYMSLGFLAAQAAGDTDPGAMMRGLGLTGAGALLLALATLTTNFVNIYMSALAWKSLFPNANDSLSVGAIGLVGAVLSLLDRTWLDRYADFMTVIGALLIPVSGILFARFFLLRREVRVEDLYARAGSGAAFDPAGLVAWLLGAAVYFLASPLGGTVPCLVVAVGSYVLLAKRG